MKAFDALKQLYIMGGGQGDIDSIQENKLANMHSVIYGDGINVELPSDFEDVISGLLENGVDVSDIDNSIINFNKMKTYYATEPLQNDPDFSSDEWVNIADYGLSTTIDGSPLTYNELVSELENDLAMNDNVKIYIPFENKFLLTGDKSFYSNAMSKVIGYAGRYNGVRIFGSLLNNKQSPNPV